MPDGPPPMLGSNRPTTLRQRADASGQIWEARQQARDQVTEQFETVDDPDRVPIRRRDGGFGAGPEFLERQRPVEAASRLDEEYPRQDLAAADVRETDRGFAPTETVERRAVARETEATTPVDDVDPFNDVTQQPGGGFGLGMGAQREVAAAELDPQFPAADIGAGDVEQQGGGAFGLNQQGEREVAAERIEDQTPLGDVQPTDITPTGSGGFELRDSVIENNRGLFE